MRKADVCHHADKGKEHRDESLLWMYRTKEDYDKTKQLTKSDKHWKVSNLLRKKENNSVVLRSSTKIDHY